MKKIDAKIKDAEESLGETDVAEPLREKAGYLVTIGDKVSVSSGVFARLSNVVYSSTDHRRRMPCLLWKLLSKKRLESEHG